MWREKNITREYQKGDRIIQEGDLGGKTHLLHLTGCRRSATASEFSTRNYSIKKTEVSPVVCNEKEITNDWVPQAPFLQN